MQAGRIKDPNYIPVRRQDCLKLQENEGESAKRRQRRGKKGKDLYGA